MIYAKKYEIGLSDIGKESKVENKSILRFLENVAESHSAQIGMGVTDINETNLTWMLLEWKLEIIKRPEYGEILDIHTWARYTSKCYSYRDFEVYDENNNKCIIATSKWLLVDLKRGRPVRVPKELMEQYKPEYGKSVFNIIELDKLEEIQKAENVKEIEIRKSDIDINGHVHNLNYLDFAYEVLPEKECEKELNNVRISFKKEIKYGEKINCKYEQKENNHKIQIENSHVNAIIELY